MNERNRFETLGVVAKALYETVKKHPIPVGVASSVALLGGSGAVIERFAPDSSISIANRLLTIQRPAFAQEVGGEEATETTLAPVESRHDYNNIKLYFPRAFKDVPQEQIPEYNAAFRRSREWLKTLFTTIDGYQHPKLNSYVDTFMAAVEHMPPNENLTFLSDFEVVMPFFMPRIRMEELDMPITEQGFHSPIAFGINPWSVKPNGIRYDITIREPYLPQESKFDYNDPSKNAYPALTFAYTMDGILRYHSQVEQLNAEGNFNRDEFVAQAKEPIKSIYPSAESLKTALGIQQELGFKNVPVFDILLVQRQLIELKFPPEEVEFEWRKFIWSVFVSKDVPVDQLR